LTPVDGVCGASARNYTYTGSSTTITSGFCSAGTSSTTSERLQATGGSAVGWTCSGTGGGIRSDCYAIRLAPILGICGPAMKFYEYDEAFPSGALCSSGTATAPIPPDPPQRGTSNWTCIGDLETDECSACRGVPESCSCVYRKEVTGWSECAADDKQYATGYINETLYSFGTGCPIFCPPDVNLTKSCGEDIPDTPDTPDIEVYYGSFHNDSGVGESISLPVTFTDASSPSQTNWTFEGPISVGCIPAFSTQLPQNFSVFRGLSITLGTLTMSVAPRGMCQVSIIARDPNEAVVIGIYDLVGPDSGVAGPSMGNVTDLPGLLFPTNIYSTKTADAESAYSSAEAAVSGFVSVCGTSCSSAASAKLADAQRHLSAAKFYEDGCTSDGDIACQLSQYYSNRAKALANEGLSVI